MTANRESLSAGPKAKTVTRKSPTVDLRASERAAPVKTRLLDPRRQSARGEVKREGFAFHEPTMRRRTAVSAPKSETVDFGRHKAAAASTHGVAFHEPSNSAPNKKTPAAAPKPARKGGQGDVAKAPRPTGKKS
jgi:hypothetical protein